MASELADRWRRARRAALEQALPDVQGAPGEEELLRLALANDPERLLRRVFDNSRRLGDSFRSYHRMDLGLADLAWLLPALGVPCVSKPWVRIERPRHLRSERSGCALGANVAGACDFFREAVDGLILGLSGAVYHARHDSVGSGGERCVDVLYVQPQSPVRFGPIPPRIAERLPEVQRTLELFDSTAAVEFLGISERVLYYRLVSVGGSTNVRLTTVIEHAVQRRYPSLTTIDVSSRAVFDAP